MIEVAFNGMVARGQELSKLCRYPLACLTHSVIFAGSERRLNLAVNSLAQVESEPR